MPHIIIKHFPRDLSQEQRTRLVSDLSEVIRTTFKVNDDAISIALEPVEKEVWNEQVYVPEIKNRADLLLKSPNY